MVILGTVISFLCFRYKNQQTNKQNKKLTDFTSTDKTVGVVAGLDQPFTKALASIIADHNTIFLVKDKMRS